MGIPVPSKIMNPLEAESLMFTAKANYYRALEEKVRLRIKRDVEQKDGE